MKKCVSYLIYKFYLMIVLKYNLIMYINRTDPRYRQFKLSPRTLDVIGSQFFQTFYIYDIVNKIFYD